MLLTAIETIGHYLPKAFANGANMEARAAMLGAATMVGTAFPFAGLIHVHTYAEVLGDLTHLPHGRLIGLMLPHVLEWVAPGCPEKLGPVARALGEPVDGLSAREGAERCLAAVRRLRAECEVEEPLRSHGMSEEAVQVCAERVFAQHAPRSIGGPRAFRTLDRGGVAAEASLLTQAWSPPPPRQQQPACRAATIDSSDGKSWLGGQPMAKDAHRCDVESMIRPA